MTRAQLEHIIRAAGTIADDNDVVVIGSQAILGEYPNAPSEFLVSNEADVYPRTRIERSDLIDATIGEGSPFQREFGYYALGVDETTAILPDGWRDRLVLITRVRRYAGHSVGDRHSDLVASLESAREEKQSHVPDKRLPRLVFLNLLDSLTHHL